VEPGDADVRIQNSEGNSHRPGHGFPPMLATYITFHMDLKKAFHYSESLVDEYRRRTRESSRRCGEKLAHDPSGPMIDNREGAGQPSRRAGHAGQRRENPGRPQERTPDRGQSKLLSAPRVRRSWPRRWRKLLPPTRRPRRREFKGHIIWEADQRRGCGAGCLAKWNGVVPAAGKSRRGRSGDDKEEEEETRREAYPAEHGLHRWSTASSSWERTSNSWKRSSARVESLPPMVKSGDYLRISDALTRPGGDQGQLPVLHPHGRILPRHL